MPPAPGGPLADTPAFRAAADSFRPSLGVDGLAGLSGLACMGVYWLAYCAGIARLASSAQGGTISAYLPIAQDFLLCKMGLRSSFWAIVRIVPCFIARPFPWALLLFAPFMLIGWIWTWVGIGERRGFTVPVAFLIPLMSACRSSTSSGT